MWVKHIKFGIISNFRYVFFEILAMMMSLGNSLAA